MPGPGRPSLYTEELAARICERSGLCAIYGIVGSDGAVRYVGKAINPNKRWLQHKADRNRLQRPLYSWMRRELDAGRPVQMVVLEWVSRDDWEAAERRLIAKHRRNGRLLNLCPGGAGGQPGRGSSTLSEDEKRIRAAKIQFSRAWKTMSEEARERIRERVIARAKEWARECPEIANYIKDIEVGVPA